MTPRDRWTAAPRWQKVCLGVSAAILLYAVAGFWLLPRFARSEAIEVFRETFGREAEIAELRVNPFVFTVEVRGFALPDRDGAPFVRFESLFVDFDLSSIWHRAFTFGEIRLTEPFVHVKILADGALNFGDMIETLLEEDPEAEEGSGPPALLVHLARIEEGRIVFTDYSRPTNFEHEITPLNVELRDFGTRPDDESPYSFAATTGAGEALEWEGSVSVVPLYSSGRFSLTGVKPRTGWLYVQDDVFFEVVDGTVDIEGSYDLDAREGLTGRLEEGEIRIRDFAVADRESGEVAVAIAAFDVKGISATYPEQALHIDAVETRGGRHHMLRLEDGAFRMEQLSHSRGEQPQVAAAAGESPPAPTTAEPAPEWSIVVDRVLVDDHRIDFEDRSTDPPVAFSITPISLQLDDVTSDPTRPIQVSLGLGFPEDGRVQIAGPVQAEPQSASLAIDVTDFDLRPFEPYWLPRMAVDLASGRLGIDAQVEAEAAAGADPQVHFDGDIRLDDFKALDHRLQSNLVSWSALQFLGLSVASESMRVELDKIVFDQPATQVLLAADGTTNLSNLVPPGDDAPAPEPAEGVGESTPLSIAIGAVEIVGGAARFEDHSVSPRFKSGVTKLNGQIEGLSSKSDSRAKVDLAGRLDGATPVRVSGVVSPLAEKTYVDLTLSFENFELSSLTPYSGRHIGQTIDRGKLFLDVSYELDGNSIKGENELFLDQFDLGEKVDSPDALNLPVGLAIALIRDRNGEIHIDLPVSGEIDDPDFSVAGLIFGALGNLITKVALSPFAMLGGLAGNDGESMRTVDFAAGEDVLGASEASKLESLAGALNDRPALSLEVTGGANSEIDRPALQAASLELALRKARYQELQSKWFGDKPESVEDVVLDARNRDRLLRKRYEQTFGEKPVEMLVPMLVSDDGNPLAQTQTAEMKQAWASELEARVAAREPIELAALRDLARRRGLSVRDYLVQTGGIAAERIFVLDVQVEEKGAEAPPRVSLELAAH